LTTNKNRLFPLYVVIKEPIAKLRANKILSKRSLYDNFWWSR